MAENLFSRQAVIDIWLCFKVEVLLRWTDEYMTLFQSFKLEVFSHWDDEYIYGSVSKFQSGGLPNLQLCLVYSETSKLV